MLTCSNIRSALAFLLLDLISFFFFFLNSCLCPLTLSCFSKLPHWPSFPTGIIILSCSCYPCRHYQPDPAINPLHKGRPKATFTANPALQQKHTFSFSFLSKEPVFYAVGCCGSQHGWKKYTHTLVGDKLRAAEIAAIAVCIALQQLMTSPGDLAQTTIQWSTQLDLTQPQPHSHHKNYYYY